MYKRILCPIDGSPASNCGMAEAVRLAHEQKADLRFIHVIDTYFPILDVAGDLNVVYMTDILRKNGEKLLESAEAAAERAGVKSGSQMIESLGGRAAEFIVEEAKKWPADLIVMGTHGLRGIGRVVMGSDAEMVLRASPVPVLMVKDAGQKS